MFGYIINKTMNKHVIRIGIDPSINSTGICIYDIGSHSTQYYIISSKMTKKMKEFEHKYVQYIPYDKIDAKEGSYSEKEYKKFSNILNICTKISYILGLFKHPNNDIEVFIEGVSYGSVGSAALIDLSFLNFAIRMTLHYMDIPFTIVSPTSLKKFACANGQADKNLMIDAWKRMDKNIADIEDIKIDDLADSYFLSCYKE